VDLCHHQQFKKSGENMKKHMRSFALAAIAVLALSACGPSDEDKAKAAEAAAAAEAAKPVPLPTDPTNKAAWQGYLVKVVMRNMQGVKTNHPYMYFVPAGDGPDQDSARKDQLDNVSTTVARGVLPGNMMAFGGPDSKRTADLIVEAFKSAGDGTLKGVIVLFVGAPADSDRVKDGMGKSGAEYRFVELK
jgi:ABC-type sugar transport system substrate-binding protein